MTISNKLFIMADQEQGYAQLVSGTDACEAVEAHYAMMDAWCPPIHDADMSDEFALVLYEVPAHMADEVTERFEDLDGDEMADQVAEFASANPGSVPVQITVNYTAKDGARASVAAGTSDLFSSGPEL